MAFMQDRLGPNRTGPQGLLQPIADALKLFGKESIIQATVDKPLFLLAPVIVFLPTVLILIAVPFAKNLTVQRMNAGLIYIVAMGSFTVIGMVIAGWSSNNKYSLLGGLRSSAQMISYEVPMILSLIVVGLLAGSLSLNRVVSAQTPWFVLVQPLAFLIFLIAGSSEINRTPFDLTEAESELTNGVLTEYGGMRFAFFYLAEYGSVVVTSMIASTLFLGGWRGPGEIPVLWLALKTILLVIGFTWIRTSLPRLQIDRLMSFSWKFLIPLSLLNITITALAIVLFPKYFMIPVAIVSWAMTIAVIMSLPVVLKRFRSKEGLTA